MKVCYLVFVLVLICVFVFQGIKIFYKIKNSDSIYKNRCGVENINQMEINENESFPIQLYSNVESPFSHRQNTVANFVTKLAEKIVLEGEWEVGLAEVSYTKSWFNIREDQALDLFTSAQEIHQNNESILRAGHYKNVEELVDKINEKYRVFQSEAYRLIVKKSPILRYDPIVNRIFIIPGISAQHDKFIYPYLTDELELILGLRFNDSKPFISYFWDYKNNKFFESDQIQLRKHILYDNSSNGNTVNVVELECPFAVQFNACELHILVYCSIIQPGLVGNTYAKLLRQVEIPEEKNFGKQCVLRYPKPFYYPLISNEIEMIEIDIKDDTGKPIPFDYGRLTVMLHFRKKSVNELKSIRRILR